MGLCCQALNTILRLLDLAPPKAETSCVELSLPFTSGGWMLAEAESWWPPWALTDLGSRDLMGILITAKMWEP